MKPIDTGESQFELKDNFYAPDQVIVEGVTPAYAEYQKEMIEKQMNKLQYLIVRTIDTLEARRSEHLGVVGELLRQNQSLKDKLKEQAK
jgi:hypothetical protein